MNSNKIIAKIKFEYQNKNPLAVLELFENYLFDILFYSGSDLDDFVMLFAGRSENELEFLTRMISIGKHFSKQSLSLGSRRRMSDLFDDILTQIGVLNGKFKVNYWGHVSKCSCWVNRSKEWVDIKHSC